MSTTGDAVWLVLDPQDRQVMEVCGTEVYAVARAREMDGIAEKWPISYSRSYLQWRDALDLARVKALQARNSRTLG